MSLRRSQLQKQVLHVYKVETPATIHFQSLLRVARNQPVLTSYVRSEFRRLTAEIPRSDIQVVEYHLRRGQRQLETLKKSTVTKFDRITIRQE